MTHGNIGTWAKQVGDAIAAGDVVCEVETDKAVSNIAFPVDEHSKGSWCHKISGGFLSRAMASR